MDRQVTPEHLDWSFSVYLVAVTVLGGKAHFFGPILGAFAVVAFRDIALRFAEYHNLLLGSMLIIVLLAAPDGLAGAVASLATRVTRFGSRARR